MAVVQNSQEQTDIFSLSDQVLSERLHFVEEIGFGNWGSVWLCRPKGDPASPSADGLDKLHDAKIAVKLVHRSKTPTTAARVRSLWNEMKIVRSFKNDPHPAIIPFHSFIITPSYALITMAYLPELVPVEVEERKAKEWFRLLLSGIEFLHRRGVVHNDIKPANILLSHRGVPVLVDFGFAEKYDLKSPKAFHSNLSYGTPEYLSPERARGLPHDTRKSDVWALGITFFEILMGRTPFEHSDTEQFSTKETLEKYWSRTLRGKWVGSWKMTKGVEKLLRRMVVPNADLRCTAADALADQYWRMTDAAHRRSASANSSVVFEDTSRFPPWMPKQGRGKENVPVADASYESPDRARPALKQGIMMRSKSHPKIAGVHANLNVPAKKRVMVTPLSPVKASPPASPAASRETKENSVPLKRNAVLRDSAPVSPGILGDLSPPIGTVAKNKARKKALMDLTGFSRNFENAGKKVHVKGSDSVKERVRDWERERERLREIAALEEIERERDEQPTTKHKQEAKRSAIFDKENDGGMENRGLHVAVARAVPRGSESNRPRSALGMDARLENESILGGLKQNLKLSIDKTLQLCKASALYSTPTSSLSVDRMEEAESRMSYSMRQSWEDDTILRDAKSSLPVVRHAIRNERVAADNKLDRMAIWMQNVEKVVEDARQNFASSNVTRLPPLPLAPLSRSASQNRGSRLPRRVLPANQIFAAEGVVDQSTSFIDYREKKTSLTDRPLPRLPSDASDYQIADGTIRSPPRQRRATISTRSPEPANAESGCDAVLESPSKRKDRFRSHGNLGQPISPISKLEFELQRESIPTPTPRLSAILDRSLFITPPLTARDDDERGGSFDSSTDESSRSNDLTSSPFHVEAYPPKTSPRQAVPDTPSTRRLEGVYDRFLMATTGVKRVGRGYQSDNIGPVSNTASGTATHAKRHPRLFVSSRRKMPPPVSSEDQLRTVSVDELGNAGCDPSSSDDNTTAAFVRRAFKAIITTTSRTVSRREL